MRVYQRHAGEDAELLIKFHWPYAEGVQQQPVNIVDSSATSKSPCREFSYKYIAV